MVLQVICWCIPGDGSRASTWTWPFVVGYVVRYQISSTKYLFKGFYAIEAHFLKSSLCRYSRRSLPPQPLSSIQ